MSLRICNTSVWSTKSAATQRQAYWQVGVPRQNGGEYVRPLRLQGFERKSTLGWHDNEGGAVMRSG